jgi:diacylglycerol O-acyltransferase / wax synthase
MWRTRARPYRRSMSRHLSPLDATFLELEDADPTAHMHVGALLIFDGPAPRLAEVRALLDARLDAIPRFRERLSAEHAGPLSRPAWVADERFDLAAHTGAERLAEPGGHEELMAWAGAFWSRRLDRDRPLWEVVLVEGLEEGRWALASKSHHCMVDGLSNVDVFTLLLDATPEPAERPAPEAEPAAEADRGAISQLLAGAEAGATAALHPRRTLRRTLALLDLLIRDEVRAAPRTSLNRPISTRRRYGVVECELADLKAIRRALGGTVNDVFLALAAGGLRALLLARGEPLPATLRAMVPVDVREAEQRLRLGNQVSSLFVELPVGEEDPFERYLTVVAAERDRKLSGEAAASSAAIELFSLAPPFLHAQLARSLFATRLFNLTLTNVPGPQAPLYALGRRMRAAHPLVPLAAEHAVGVAAASYDGHVAFGVNADHRVDDLDVLLDGLRDGLEELLEIAGVRGIALREPVG